MDANNVLQVRMMGSFSMTWNGTEVWCGTKAQDSQLTRLLQVLLYNRKKGIERSKLKAFIFDDSNSDDTGHLMRSVIYNTQKKLEKSCLPAARYIEFRDGRYYWTDSIPVQIDTELFEELCAAAKMEKDPEKKLECCKKAAYAYNGEFLPEQTGLTWVAGEDRRLKSLFRKNAEDAADIMRDKHDYAAIERLGRFAADACPLDDWELLIVEAYIFTGRLNEAQRIFEKTLEHYQKELGLNAQQNQLNAIERLFEQADRSSYFIEDIAKDLGETKPADGGMYCSYPVFRGIYRSMVRGGSEPRESSWLMLCTLKAREGSGMTHIKISDRLSERMKSAICRATGMSDVVCRLGREQFLIILRNRSVESCEEVKAGIENCFDIYGLKNEAVAFSMLPITGPDTGKTDEGGAIPCSFT